jgi:hypothetical protein
LARLRVIRDSWKPPTQFYDSRQFSLLIEGGSDSSRISFGNNEHPKRLPQSTPSGKSHYAHSEAPQNPETHFFSDKIFASEKPNLLRGDLPR